MTDLQLKALFGNGQTGNLSLDQWNALGSSKRRALLGVTGFQQPT